MNKNGWLKLQVIRSKAARFYQEALDHVARQGYADAHFEVDIVKEFCADEENSGQHQQPDDLTDVQYIQKGLKQNVRAVI